jgi:hypothetical protein
MAGRANRRSFFVEELVLETVEDANEEIFAFDPRHQIIAQVSVMTQLTGQLVLYLDAVSRAGMLLPE